MKRLYAALAILLLILSGTLFVGHKIAQTTDGYIQQLTLAQQLAYQDDWDRARSITETVYSDWQDHTFPFHALLRHNDTDQILLSFRAVEQYLLLEEMDQYAAANATLITQLELLAEMEQPTVENVL